MNCKKFFATIILCVSIIVACGNKSENTATSPPGYDLSVFEKILLPDVLLEVSGIAFAPGKFDSIYVNQDEDGIIFKVELASEKYHTSDFGIPGDFEDIAIQNDTLLVLQSDGSFYGFTLSDLHNRRSQPFAIYKKILPKGEYEGLFADSLTGSYYAMCKSCKGDKKNKQLSIYQLQFINGELTPVKKHIMSTEKILEYANNNIAFQPSALARHPLTQDFYIISSINKSLIVVNNNWEVSGIYPLDRKTLMQPEGLAFDKYGNMYISSEGDELQSARILKFHYSNDR
jgi:hypothetical protein